MKMKTKYTVATLSFLAFGVTPLFPAYAQTAASAKTSLIDTAAGYLSGNASSGNTALTTVPAGSGSDLAGYLSGAITSTKNGSNSISLNGWYDGASSSTSTTPVGTTTNGVSIDQYSAADCDDLKARLNTRFQNDATAVLPTGQPSDATNARGLREIMNMANGADPVAAVTAAAVRAAVDKMIAKADTYIADKVTNLRNAINNGLTPEQLKALGVAKDAASKAAQAQQTGG